MKIYFVLILIITLVIMIYNSKIFEKFGLQMHQAFFDHTNFPFWNTRIGQTTNMSYDLRGDPIIIPKRNFLWNNSGLVPIYNVGI